jgi:hypothetical protein
LDNKVYRAGKGAYKAPVYGFWKGEGAPDATDAKCLTLDIPVSIGYCLLKNSQRSIFVNSGLSSYWMLTENYQYIYNNPNPEQRQQWVGKRESFHKAGALTFSVTYEKHFTRKLSFLIEPYYKQPLAGIGYGSIELLSSGVNVGLKYRAFKNKSDP